VNALDYDLAEALRHRRGARRTSREIPTMTGLRLPDGHALCVEPDEAAYHYQVFTDHTTIDRCGEVQILDRGDHVVVLFVQANRVLCITPDGRLETRAPDRVALWEQLYRTAAGIWRHGVAGTPLVIDGAVVVSPPSGGPLHLEQRGHDFVDAQGHRIVLPGIDGFDDLWFATEQRVSELDALLVESKQLAMKVRRIWCMGDAGENQVFSLYPQRVPNYFEIVRALVAYENSVGVIPLLTCFVDAQRVMPNQSDRYRFWRDLNEALVGSGAYLMSGGNQRTKNGFDAWADISDPGPGVIWSRGSSTDDEQTVPRGAPASELHATRVSFDRALMDATASPPEMRKPANGSGMVWMTEGNPFGDDRGYSITEAWALGRAYSILWSLAVFHNRQSQRGVRMTDETARRAAAWVRGMRL
jgi:hypothetical protein